MIDSACIFDYDSDAARTPLRTYAGAAGKKLVTEKLVIKAKSEDSMDSTELNEAALAAMPSVYTLQEGKMLEVNAKETHFTGAISIAGDLTLEGELILQSKDKSQSEMRIMNSFVEVNSPNTDDPDYEFPGPRDGGLEVYRGDGGTHDARIVWVEADQCFKAGIGSDLKKIAYGNEWDSLIKYEFADLLHRHSKLSSPGGLSFGFTGADKVYSDADLALKDDKILWLKGTNPDTIDSSHGLGWFGTGKPFAAAAVDGPVLFGAAAGFLAPERLTATAPGQTSRCSPGIRTAMSESGRRRCWRILWMSMAACVFSAAGTLSASPLRGQASLITRSTEPRSVTISRTTKR